MSFAPRAALATLAAGLAVVLVGCTPAEEPLSPQPRDPILALTDPTSEFYVADGVDPYLYEHGSGPARFGQPAPDSPKLALYLTCQPSVSYRVEVGEPSNFFAGVCASELTNAAIVVVPTSLPDGQLEVFVDVPATEFTLVALPVE